MALELKDYASAAAALVSGVALYFSRRTFLLNYNPAIWVSTGEERGEIEITNLGSRAIVITRMHFYFHKYNQFSPIQGKTLMGIHKSISIEPNKSKVHKILESPAFNGILFSVGLEYRFGSDSRKVHYWSTSMVRTATSGPIILKQIDKQITALKYDRDSLLAEMLEADMNEDMCKPIFDESEMQRQTSP